MDHDSTGAEANRSHSDFNDAVEAYRQASSVLERRPETGTEFFSRRDDVTLANPLGPPRPDRPTSTRRSPRQRPLQRRLHPGFEEVSRYSTADLGYVVQIERTEARLAGSEDMAPSRCGSP